MLTFVIEDATIFEGKYTVLPLFHRLEVVANLQAGKILYRAVSE